MKLKSLLNENVLGDLPSSKLKKMKWNPVTDREPVNEGLKSNIMQKWDTVQAIQKDLQSFIDSASGAGGEDLVNDIYMALKNSTEYARRVIRKG